MHRRWRERGPVLAVAASGVAQAVLLGLGVVWLVHLATTGRVSAGDLALGLVLLGSAVDDASGLGSAVGADPGHEHPRRPALRVAARLRPPSGQVH